MSRRVIPGLEPPDAALEADYPGAAGPGRAGAGEGRPRRSPSLLSETSSYLIAAGGKRFRAMLVLLSGYFGDPTDPRLIPGSVSIELVHLATLYHDDVIDEADARRGVPSANMRWDNTVAILSGDFLFARASEISPSWGRTCAGCSPGRSPSSATARSARWTAPRRSSSPRATTWRSSGARPRR